MSCTEKDTNAVDVWPRTVEPRLSTVAKWEPCRKMPARPGRIVEETQCTAVQPTPIEACDDIVDHAEALRVLTSQPHCIDNAILALERFARTDAGAMSDVAAAYYVRAQREDRPSDFLRALRAAEQAVLAAPQSPAAFFNRALAEEALGLPAQAILSWDNVRHLDDGAWRAEARAHRERLAREIGRGPVTQWAINRARLRTALRARDRAAVARLIAPFPAAAQRYFEADLLGRWAEEPSEERLADAKLLASEWLRRTGDRYCVDVVAAIERAGGSPEKLDALRKGHLAFRDGRLAEWAIDYAAAANHYERAEQWLARGESPLRFLAATGFAVMASFDQAKEALALETLARVERELRGTDYPNVRGRIAASRTFILPNQSRLVEALAESEAAQSEYTRIGDEESIAKTRGSRSTVLSAVGQQERAWSEAYQAIRALPHLVEFQYRHRLLGNAAKAALALDQPQIALQYQNNALSSLRAELAHTPPERLDSIAKLQTNIAVASRWRAVIELALTRYERARRDLAEAARLSGSKRDDNVRRLLQARMEEVLGQSLLSVDANRAAEAFRRALQLSSMDQYRTFRASLFAQRADALRQAKRNDESEKDLRSALDELHAEEALILAHRERGADERLWSSYFSRFQETYRLLIQQLVENHREEEAFAFAEKARAFEPLDLLRHLDSLPPASRFLVNDTAMSVAQIRASLPRGTFLIEYCVLDDSTYVWVLSRDHFKTRKLAIGRRKIEEWTETLQRSAKTRAITPFETVLFQAYVNLIREPLSDVEALTPGGRPERLVFIPDGAMHGLPFSALRDPVSRQYVVQKAPVEVAGSTKLYVFSLLQDRSLARPKDPAILLIGDPAFDETLPLVRGLKRLPFAEKEADEIRVLYPTDAAIRGTGTVPDFLKNARRSAIVHVAGHAIVNADAPSRSMLLLAPSEHHSGVLDAEELLKTLKLDRTRLVVLSTCSSAGGLPVGPEGVAPLVRPLIAAGVPAVIGSLWDVGDATSKELMVSFHRHYRQGSDAAVAMQTAQLDLLRKNNPGFASVFAWAPFQVIGHASSPYEPAQHN